MYITREPICSTPIIARSPPEYSIRNAFSWRNWPVTLKSIFCSCCGRCAPVKGSSDVPAPFWNRPDNCWIDVIQRAIRFCNNCAYIIIIMKYCGVYDD